MILRALMLVPAHPILALPFVFLFVEAGLNATFGWRQAGGGLLNPGAWLVAAMYAAFALIAAEIVMRWHQTAGRRPVRALYALMIAICIGWSQLAGWAVTGVRIADAQVTRDDQATRGDVTRSQLADARAELKGLAGVASPAEIESRIAAQLATWVKGPNTTLGAATRDCQQPAIVPTLCKRVEEMRAELARARRKAELTGQVSSGAVALERAPHVASGAVDVAIPVGILQRAGVEGRREEIESAVRFWLNVFMVAAVSMLATFGFAAVGFTHGDFGGTSPPARKAEDSFLEPGRHPVPAPVMRPIYARRAPAPRPAEPEILPPSGQRGGDIHITVGAGASPVTAPADRSGLPSAGAPLVPVEPPSRAAAKPLPSPAPARRPVDRSAVEALMDQLLVFREACLVDRPGAMLSLEQVYARYASWSHGRGMDRGALETMLPTITGLSRVDFGGVAHLADVELRSTSLAVAS